MARREPPVGKNGLTVDQATQAILAIGNEAAKAQAERLNRNRKELLPSGRPENLVDIIRGMARAGAQELLLNYATK
jgi:hypothetical protein